MSQPLLDVAAVAELSSAIGTLVVSATPSGIARVEFKHRVHSCAEDRMEHLLVEVEPAHREQAQAWADEAVEQLDEYFMLKRERFDVPLYGPHGDGFRVRAQRALSQIPYGSRLTYAQLAEMAGNASAVRAAGTACASNPLPILLPCHRIVRSDGRLGAYLGGEQAKAHLLQMESVGLTGR